MSSVFFRVDDRLIHGQIVEGWAKFLHATMIIVIDDRIANDPLQKSIMEIAVPSEIKVIISTVADSVRELKTSSNKTESIIALFSNLEDVLRAVTYGLKLEKLNLGGIRFEQGKKAVSKTVFLSPHDNEILQKLIRLGIEINVQAIPSETSRDIQQMLERSFNI